MNLNENELQTVQAGNSYGMSERSALRNPNLYRVTKIEQLRQEQNNNYQKSEVNYKVLEYLRSNIKLNPLDKFRVLRERYNAESWKKTYRKFEPNDDIAVDYTKADRLELELRLKSWQNFWLKVWQRYGDGQSLEEFANDALRQNMEEDMNKGRSR